MHTELHYTSKIIKELYIMQRCKSNYFLRILCISVAKSFLVTHLFTIPCWSYDISEYDR